MPERNLDSDEWWEATRGFTRTCDDSPNYVRDRLRVNLSTMRVEIVHPHEPPRGWRAVRDRENARRRELRRQRREAAASAP